MSPTEEVLTTGEAASLLSVSPITIRRWVKSGRLEGHRVGHLTVVLRQDVESALRAQLQRKPREVAVGQ